MSDILGAAVSYIDRRLDTMEPSPGTWGSSESLELQALLLLEVRTYLLRRRTYDANPYEVRDVYIRFVSRHFPDSPASFMADALPPERVEEELPKLLRELRGEVVAHLGLEDPFTTSALALEMRFGEQVKTGSFRRACRYFERFVRSIEAIARGEEAIGPGRALIFPVPDVRVLQSEGGGGPRVQLLFDRPRGKRATVRSFFDALRKALAMAAWATGGEDPGLEKLRASFPDATEWAWLAASVRGMSPRGAIESVTIGGKALRREPVVLTRAAARRLDEIGRARRVRIADVLGAWAEGYPPLQAVPPRMYAGAGR